MRSGSYSIIVAFPTGGRCLVELNVNEACHDCVLGIANCCSRAATPATGVDATRCPSASSALGSSLSIRGSFCGIARPNLRVSAPNIPELPLTLNDA